MLFGTFGTSLLGNLLTGKGAIATSQGKGKDKGVLRAGEGVLRASYSRPSISASQNKIDF